MLAQASDTCLFVPCFVVAVIVQVVVVVVPAAIVVVVVVVVVVAVVVAVVVIAVAVVVVVVVIVCRSFLLPLLLFPLLSLFVSVHIQKASAFGMTWVAGDFRRGPWLHL